MTSLDLDRDPIAAPTSADVQVIPDDEANLRQSVEFHLGVARSRINVEISNPAHSSSEPPRWSRLAPIGVATATLYVVVIAFFHPTFATNDDTAMWGIASGVLYGTPSADLVFINDTIGWALAALYRVSGSVPWYSMMLYGLQAIGVAGMAWSAMSSTIARRRIAVIAGAAAMGLLVPLVVAIQFTGTSMTLTGVGLALLARGVSQRQDLDPPATWLGVAAGAAIGLGYLLRSNGAVGAIAATLPFVAWALWRGRSHWRFVLVAGAATLCVLVAGRVVPAITQQDPDAWEQFDEFNAARSQLHDTPRLQPDDELGELLEEVGWTWADRAMFDNWFFTNPSVFETDDLERLVEARRGVTEDVSLEETLRSLVAKRGLGWLMISFAFAALAVTVRRTERIILAIGVVWSAGLALYLAMFLRFPDRVADPMLLVVLAVGVTTIGPSVRSVASIDPRRQQTTVLFLGGVLGALAATSLFVGGADLLDRSDRVARARARTAEFDVVAEALGPEGVAVNWGGFLSMNASHPLLIEQHPGAEMNIVGLGWRSRTPPFDEQLRSFDMENVELAIADRPDVAVVTSSHQANLFSAYLWDHYGRSSVLWPETPVRDGAGFVYRSTVDAVEFDGQLELQTAWNTAAAYQHLGRPALGRIDLVAGSETALGSVSGWIAHPDTGGRPDSVLVLIDDTLAGRITLTTRRTNDLGVDEGFNYFVTVPAVRLEGSPDIRVIATFGDRWAEASP